MPDQPELPFAPGPQPPAQPLGPAFLTLDVTHTIWTCRACGLAGFVNSAHDCPSPRGRYMFRTFSPTHCLPPGALDADAERSLRNRRDRFRMQAALERQARRQDRIDRRGG